MNVLYLVLYILAAVCFAVAAFTNRSTVDDRRGITLVPLGLFFWVLVPLIQHVDTL